jgi:hypothetical protein
MFFYPLKPHDCGPSYGGCALIVALGVVPRFPLLDRGTAHPFNFGGCYFVFDEMCLSVFRSDVRQLFVVLFCLPSRLMIWQARN